VPSKDDFKGRQDDNLYGYGEPAPGLKALASAPKPKGREVSGVILRLARRLGVDPDELTQKIPPDTLRRLKYPLLEQETEEGTRTFTHDPGIVEGRRAEIRP
jgi:hypothetical protein